MSGESYTQREERYRDLRMQSALRGVQKMADDRRREVLKALLESNRVAVTPWEDQFVADHVQNPRPFTDKERDAIDGIRKKYEHKIK